MEDNLNFKRPLSLRASSRVLVSLFALFAMVVALLPGPAYAITTWVVMWSRAASRYVTANISQTNAPLQARASAVGSWEEFTEVYVSTDSTGERVIALRSQANGRYVSARLGQTDAPLEARATSVGSWEKFKIVGWADGSESLWSVGAGKYVTARISQTNSPLQARADIVGSWERFDIYISYS